MKELIINADDFGLSRGANLGIIRAWQEGILTSASLMVGGLAFDEAVSLAKANPGLQVGLHLTLLQGRAVAKHPGFPTLVDREGNFTNDPVMAGMRYFFLKPLRKQLAGEIEAQIEKFLATGLPLSHIDGHLNIHMHPVVFDILLQLMPRYGITSFRLSRERFFDNIVLDRQRMLGKAADAFIFASLAKRCRPELEMRKVSFAGEVKGLLNSGCMTEPYLLKALERLRPGLSEIYFHPGCYPCDELKKWMPDYLHEGELAALTSQVVKEKLMSLGVILRNYRGEKKAYA
ncbi:hydrolase, putative [Geotalea daltonii FRC-32]|uniref:Hydrolase, putative n=1 Tax=Geotalea daltonii (strain DSM 22248 / JCM 15807 / FRC-32) TaxID=316067 RepID=B9LZ91_GEODF|nr:hopanoid biosynthesis-associated protein HpnK [Geotalea daltonii]ACM20644.1 hydrolase, putative [Geotalea daltonii FRC-32]